MLKGFGPANTGAALVALLAVGGILSANTLRLGMDLDQPVMLKWLSVPGERYRLMAADDLLAPFASVSNNVPASGLETLWEEPSVATPQRFYRLALTRDPGSTSWWQHAHDALRTGYAPAAPPLPWRWAWQWNGSDALGRLVTNKILLPRNVQPIVAAGRVFVAAGTNGIVSLNASNGQEIWRFRTNDAFTSTVAYDPRSDRIFAVSTNGRLYRLIPATGASEGTITLGSGSTLPLPPAIYRGTLWATMNNRLICYDTVSKNVRWIYTAPAVFETPPAYSPNHDLVVACDAALYVVAVDNRTGSLRWRMKPGIHSPSSDTTYALGWPVIAEQHEIVLVRLRIPWDYLWVSPDPFAVPTNSVIRQRLNDEPGARCHFALRLQDGQIAFDINNGAGGYGDGGYLPIGSMPIIRVMPDGREIAYNIIRGDHRWDARWDSHFGEIVLDNETVPGLRAGDVRWIRHGNNPTDDDFLLTDEQPFLSAAGDYLFGSHWLVTYAIRPLDRGPAYGSFAQKIDSTNVPWMIVSQGVCGPCTFTTNHYCAAGLSEDPGCGRNFAGGFYVCFNQGAVQDQYWTEYGCVIGLPDRLIVRDAAGAIFCLVSAQLSGQASGSDSKEPVENSKAYGPGTESDMAPAPPVQATFRGELKYVFNNGKQIPLGFADPHRGARKILIERKYWSAFEGLGTEMGRNLAALWAEGDFVEATGVLGYYQGDEVIRISGPTAITATRRREAEFLLGGP